MKRRHNAARARGYGLAGRHVLAAAITLLAACGTWCPAAPIHSDGSDGAFQPTGSMTVDMRQRPDGIYNFTTINVPAGVTVRFISNAANTPVFFAATGDVIVDGTVVVSDPAPTNNPTRGPGPGGYWGGLPGSAADPSGSGGDGPGGGGGGAFARGAGGGGGNGTPGLEAWRYGPPAPGGAALSQLEPLRGGSGGGGGADATCFGVPIDGGYGGGGGGAIQISTPGEITISGTIMANGMHGGWGFANVLCNAGPGGGGAGGTIELIADHVAVLPGAVLQGRGGFGGGLSTQTYSWDPEGYGSGATGGFGLLRLDSNSADVPFTTLDIAFTGIPGGGLQEPLLPPDPTPGEPWAFGPIPLGTNAAGRRIPIWFDPVVAIGYDYEVSGGRFAGVTMPAGFGDDLYDLLLFDPDTSAYADSGIDLQGGAAYDLTVLDPNGLDRFRILGIEPGANVDPDDPQGFPTGLTFAEAGTVEVTMTPVVPEPGGLVLGAAALAALAWRRRRRR